ncbi:hypothetical protein Q4F19_07210 [Sphingomonas sp. BIUV-7]|uniref:Uncharacterized protein n=1 Tax=Sphingomonas natans TaxID=3063330 RepID=A0ABT8Y915_9SPHN|nr:hypothetical protein [Sphingomonas sp. BIUV-7]MDO6414165.1 hypothetical protein [Sphingomonas sp. BIUV-7]
MKHARIGSAIDIEIGKSVYGSRSRLLLSLIALLAMGSASLMGDEPDIGSSIMILFVSGTALLAASSPKSTRASTDASLERLLVRPTKVAHEERSPTPGVARYQR